MGQRKLIENGLKTGRNLHAFIGTIWILNLARKTKHSHLISGPCFTLITPGSKAFPNSFQLLLYFTHKVSTFLLPRTGGAVLNYNPLQHDTKTNQTYEINQKRKNI
jgi:hypothetical protein